MSFLYKLYKEKIIWDFLKIYSFNFVSQCPKIIKIILNLGCGGFFFDKNKMQSIVSDFFLITSQKPLLIKCKKSVANFKIRKGNYIAIKITIRKKKMYEFLYKLINIIFPRIRDFRGFSLNSFDGFGNYNFGIKEYSIFPEISNYSDIIGFNINIVISNFSNDHSFFLLKSLNFPFKILNG